MNKFITYWLPVILWAGIIFWLSSLPDLKSGLKEDFVLRKIAHALEFAILTILLFRAIYNYESKIKKAISYSIVLAVFYALSDEFHQSFIRGREGNLRDVGIDVVGILIAIFLCYIKISKNLGKVDLNVKN